MFAALSIPRLACVYEISPKAPRQFAIRYEDQHFKQSEMIRRQQFSTCCPRFSSKCRANEICSVLNCSVSCTSAFVCVVADITSTLLSLSSMRKSDRETYGTCLNHNEESRFKSLVKHLLERTVTIGCRRVHCLRFSQPRLCLFSFQLAMYQR